MVTYNTLSTQAGPFLAMTGLTVAEFRELLAAFEAAYERSYPPDQTAQGHPRQRWPGAGRHSVLTRVEDKLLFVLVYLKTYPLQVVLGQLFGLSTSQANYWLHHLLPVLRSALEGRGMLPERDGGRLACRPAPPKGSRVVIIDGTERRRQRPKSPEKQALHYSGKKKTHTDKNVVIVTLPRERVGFLSHTCVGKTHDKKIADTEGIVYPPEAILYKDTGFQGYEPVVQETRQPKKKAAPRRAHRC